MRSKRIPVAGKYRRKMAFGRPDFFHSRNVLAFSSSPLTYNFDMSSGALRAGYGTKLHELVPQRAVRYWVYRFYSEESGAYKEQYLFQWSNGLIQVYDADTDKTMFLSNKQFPPVTAFNYRLNSVDTVFFTGMGGKLTSWNGKQLVTHDSPPISSMALHYERLFVTSADEPTKVFFSDDLDPTNWNVSSSGAGFIELLDERGYLNKVVSFGNYLYIFRDHGISRVTAFGDQKEFSVTNLFVSAGRIYPSSVITCGDAMVFLASDGLYVFDGYECRRVLAELDGLIVPDDDCACEYFDGKYYLACKMKFGDGKSIGCESGSYTANGLLVYTPATGEFAVSRGLDITYMHACSFLGEDFLMCNEGGKGCVITRCGARRGESLPKHWSSPPTDFSTAAQKHILSVHADTFTPFTVTFKAEGDDKCVAFDGSTKEQRVDFSGNTITLAIDTSAVSPDIPPLTLYYSVYE